MKARTSYTLTTKNDGLSRLVYVHVPKTGGNTVGSSIKVMANLGHRHAKSRQEDRCFSTIRNPFDWLISLWHSDWNPPGLGPTWWRNVGHLEPGTVPIIPKASIRDVWPRLENFLYEFNSFEPAAWKPWNEIFGRDWWPLYPPAGNFDQSNWTPLYSYRHLQVCQTFDDLSTPGEKHSFAEFYIRLERLEEAINQFPENKIYQNRAQRVGSSSHRDYRYYYDTKLIDHISAHRKQELDLLGYDFEGPTDELSIFKINKPFVWAGSS